MTCCLCGLASCATDNTDAPVNPGEPEELSDVIDEFWDFPGNVGDPDVIAALQSIENVEDLKPFFNVELGQAYYFNYTRSYEKSGARASFRTTNLQREAKSKPVGLSRRLEADMKG